MALRELALPTGTRGRVYLSSMPGRHARLDADISDMDSVRISRIVSLACSEEVERKSPEYADRLNENALGLAVESFAIPDFGVPPNLAKFTSFVQHIVSCLAADDRLLLHCGAGIGRTGTVAACILIALGMNETSALEAVKRAGSRPETDEQRAFVRRFAANQ